MAHQLPRAIRAVRRRSRPPARDQCSWCAGPIRGQNRPKSPRPATGRSGSGRRGPPGARRSRFPWVLRAGERGIQVRPA